MKDEYEIERKCQVRNWDICETSSETCGDFMKYGL